MTTNKEAQSSTAGQQPTAVPPPAVEEPVKFAQPSDDDMVVLSNLRASSGPWKERGETPAESIEALTKLRPFIQVGKQSQHVVGYVTIERDGPVTGAAYMRNIVVKPEVRKRGVGKQLLDRAVAVAREMNRKTLVLRVDPANAAARSFFHNNGFTYVETKVSKKSGKLRLLMSREL